MDFNPVVFQNLRARGVRVIYGDISQRETLMHAGVAQAKIILCTIPNALLKGTTNERFVKQLRELNPTARIIVTADVLAEAPALYEAGANYLSLPRLDEAIDLCDALEAAMAGLLDEKKAKVDALLAGHRLRVRQLSEARAGHLSGKSPAFRGLTGCYRSWPRTVCKVTSRGLQPGGGRTRRPDTRPSDNRPLSVPLSMRPPQRRERTFP
ncbi:MAG: NAD-binding protein [Chthoniobacteraceae bacterium]